MFRLRIPLKIMLVEDDLINQRMGLRFLQHFKYDPTVANDGIEAVQLARKDQYDLIFMDIFMPNMSGIEATIEIFKINGQMRPIIIPLTGNATEEQIDECHKAGMTDFISKPFKKKQLIEAIEKYGNKV